MAAQTSSNAPRQGARRPPIEKLGAIVAERLQRLINRKGRTYEKIADLSGLDVAELRRIGRGEDAPTIAHLWRIANALGVPFGSLIASKESLSLLVMRKNEAQPVRSGDGGFVSRALYPYDFSAPGRVLPGHDRLLRISSDPRRILPEPKRRSLSPRVRSKSSSAESPPCNWTKATPSISLPMCRTAIAISAWCRRRSISSCPMELRAAARARRERPRPADPAPLRLQGDEAPSVRGPLSAAMCG